MPQQQPSLSATTAKAATQSLDSGGDPVCQHPHTRAHLRQASLPNQRIRYSRAPLCAKCTKCTGVTLRTAPITLPALCPPPLQATPTAIYSALTSCPSATQSVPTNCRAVRRRPDRRAMPLVTPCTPASLPESYPASLPALHARATHDHSNNLEQWPARPSHTRKRTTTASALCEHATHFHTTWAPALHTCHKRIRTA